MSITSAQGLPTRVAVTEWELDASSYPRTLHKVTLQGVAFPDHKDVLEALQTALDVVRRQASD